MKAEQTFVGTRFYFGTTNLAPPLCSLPHFLLSCAHDGMIDAAIGESEIVRPSFL